ncbi:hypothetical protein AEAC466_02070 [Asticcacaulis sp. AC466]|uniref:hypothetical protein n=1 Tax=Asticcacaulis sp. AC466 TaxID=1282362 RepID=UPI0003C3B627|nr:hypothetical protein [Asticcacaulis sp. AC466]ESQ85994.1 hypothetical protein AEAC466_02070 [Asticcacaulis sp. AC466]
MLSAKAKAAAEKIKSFDENDVQSISEMVRHEVEHATHVLAERAKEAEARVRHFADHAGDDVKRYSGQAKQKIEENPVPATLIALGVGFVLGALLIRGRD